MAPTTVRLSQPARRRNVRAIAQYLASGCKQHAQALGIELEHILVDPTGDPISYSQPDGVRDVLENLSARYPQRSEHAGDLLGVARGNLAVTIEPAAQLELSAGPFDTLDAAQKAFETFEAELAEALAPMGNTALTVGYDPVNIAANKEPYP